MHIEVRTRFGIGVIAILLVLLAACGTSATAVPQATVAIQPTATSQPTATPQPTAEPTQVALPTNTPAPVPGIVDPTNRSWPREVKGKNGTVTIKQKPQRVISTSLGYDEILVSLVEKSRIPGLSKFSYEPKYSNILDVAAQIPNVVAKDVESVISFNPDLVIADSFAKPEFVQQIAAVGITVVQDANAETSVGSQKERIRLIAYMVGEEDRGERLVGQIDGRLKFVLDRIGQVPEAQKPRVLLLGFQSKWTGGTGTYIDSTVTQAGGINLPSREFSGHKKIGDESIVAMNPQIIILDSQEVLENDAQNVFLRNPGLAEVDAIKNGRVYPVTGKYMGNLSHWAVRGVEDIAKILFPEKFAGVEFPRFTNEANPN